MSNIIQAFINIVNNHQTNIENITHGNNRINNMGKGLEIYVKNMFANTTKERNTQKRLELLEQTFSYNTLAKK